MWDYDIGKSNDFIGERGCASISDDDIVGAAKAAGLMMVSISSTAGRVSSCECHLSNVDPVSLSSEAAHKITIVMAVKAAVNLINYIYDSDFHSGVTGSSNWGWEVGI